MRLVWVAVLGLLGPGAALAQNQRQLDLCAQGTPQFTQACPCIVERSTASGIAGDILDKLLVNDTGGVPIETFQAYGLFYTQCIQAAVTGTLPMATAPAPVAPTPPPATPPVTTTTRELPGPPPQGPIIEGLEIAGFDRPPVTMFMREALEPGRWGDVSTVRGTGWQSGGPGVHDGQGRMLMLQCRPPFFTSREFMVLGGVTVPNASAPVNFTVTRGSGAVLIEGFSRALAVDGPFLMMDLNSRTVDALRAGARVRFEVTGGPVVEFGLSGSNAAIGRGACASGPFRPTSFMALEFWVPNGGWQDAAIARADGMLSDPAIAHETSPPYLPSVSLRCDNRLQMSQVYGYGFPTTAEIQIGAGSDITTIPLTVTADTPFVRLSQPLTEAELAQIAGTPLIGISFDQNVEPGEFTFGWYRTDGFAERISDLECLPDPGSIAAEPVFDLTQSSQTWQPTDYGPLLSGNAANPPSIPMAVFPRQSDALGLSLAIGCDGYPNVVDPWPGPNFTVRMTLNGDPATTRDVLWGATRSIYVPRDDFFDMAQMILRAETLRMTLVTDPRLDVLYPLSGLQEALTAAGCQ